MTAIWIATAFADPDPISLAAAPCAETARFEMELMGCWSDARARLGAAGEAAEAALAVPAEVQAAAARHERAASAACGVIDGTNGVERGEYHRCVTTVGLARDLHIERVATPDGTWADFDARVGAAARCRDTACAAERLAAADALLNEAWKWLDVSDGPTLETQRTWIAWRDAQCGWEAARRPGDPGVREACLAALTDRRLEELLDDSDYRGTDLWRRWRLHHWEGAHPERAPVVPAARAWEAAWATATGGASNVVEEWELLEAHLARGVSGFLAETQLRCVPIDAACAARWYAEQDAALNAAWTALGPRKDTFLPAQRAWLAWRDGACGTAPGRMPGLTAEASLAVCRGWLAHEQARRLPR